MRTTIRRAILAAVAGILVVTTIGLTPAEARHRHYGNAAAVAAVVGLFGTIAALAAADQYRDDYYGYGPYYGGYYPAPYAYYGGGYRGYRYGGGHWHHHHH
jgi:hypothetical protein